MNGDAINGAADDRHGGLAEARHALRLRWQALASRERMGVALAVGVVALLLLWLLALAPALHTLKTAPPEAEALEASWQEMQRLAAEARELRGAAPVLPAQAQAALGAATARLGDAARLTLQGDGAVLTLQGPQGASGEQLAGWLAEARVGARARVSASQLTRTPQGGYVGSVSVALGASR